MAQYRFTLYDYHAILSAEIKLDGITVISGCNGSGKSTIARWLYAFVNYSNEFNRLIDRHLLTQINGRLSRMYRVVRSIDHKNSSVLRQFKPIQDTWLIDNDELDYDELMSVFQSKVDLFCDVVDTALSQELSPSVKKWIKLSLRVDDDQSEDFLGGYHDDMIDAADRYIDSAIKAKRECRFDELLRFIRGRLDIYNDAPENIFFEENGHNLIGKSFVPPIGLRNAIYIDTPMALSTRKSSDNTIWDNMMDALVKPKCDISYEAKKLAARIRRIIGGNIIVEENEFTKEMDIRYVRKQDSLDISIDEAATGLKSFAYMLRLIENGHLNSDSILLIDEPEAHLHPQWIVEFARILVLLQKEVGTKILIASHNPDMVAAIQSIAKAEGLSDKTSFYQALSEGDSLRYTYKYLGNDIEEIFRSFNIALERIKYYGC